MPREIAKSSSQKYSSPDYIGLVKFLLEPFLEENESLRVDCEHVASTNKIWLRVAFDSGYKGKVFGRGGRNIQAVGKILQTAAANADRSLRLDVYNSDRPKTAKPQNPSKARPRRVDEKSS